MPDNDNEPEIDAQLREALVTHRTGRGGVGGVQFLSFTPPPGQATFALEVDKRLREMDMDSRKTFFENLRDWYCMHCGALEPESGPYCHCTNDE